MTIYIQENQPFSAPIKWVFALIAANKQAVFNYTNSSENADLIISNSINSGIYLDFNFYKKINNNDFNVQNPLNTEGGYSDLNLNKIDNYSTNKIDLLAAIFYLVNCLQEYNSTALDVHQRFQFSASWQAQTGTITDNTVQTLINLFLENQPRLAHLATKIRESCMFLTHDIDGLYNAWRTEGLWAAKNFRLDKILHLLYLEAIRRPAWFNIDDILKLHSEYDMRSTFFFLTEKGRNTEGVTHADYDVKLPKIQQLFSNINTQKSEIGLHKSALINLDFNSELNKLPLSKIKSNRFHFLKFQLPEAWQTMEHAGVDLDASLGFAEQYGFRNSYGLPFSPYNFETQKAMNLMVTPLNIMDGTISHYMGMPDSEVAKTVIEFLEKHRKDAILSLLWHNREFSPFRYGAYLGIYKEILRYLHEAKMPTITASEAIEKYIFL
jgi:peptidoglycan/xylan/chitin deacetylase (PgdA/CDA1 family)